MFFHPGSPNPLTTEDFSELRSEWYDGGCPEVHPYTLLEERPSVVAPLVRFA